MDEIECVVIGAGVIGLASARTLALAGREIINLLGIESPGLTASLAIADHVATLATEILDA